MNFERMTKEKKSKLEKDLADHLKKITGLNFIELKIMFYANKRGDECLEVVSHELVDYMYPKMFKSLKLINFGGGWGTRDEQGRETYWLPIHYHYEHFGHGTNGSSAATFWITGDGEITEVHSELIDRR